MPPPPATLCYTLPPHAHPPTPTTTSPLLPTPPPVTKLEWQSPLQIAKYPDPCLRAVNARIGVFDESLLRLAKEMIAIMYQ